MSYYIPEQVKTVIDGMIDGTVSRRIGHMMFADNENFRTEPFEPGLCLIRNHQTVQLWIKEGLTALEQKSRAHKVKVYTADAIRYEVLRTFDDARYPGD